MRSTSLPVDVQEVHEAGAARSPRPVGPGQAVHENIIARAELRVDEVEQGLRRRRKEVRQ